MRDPADDLRIGAPEREAAVKLLGDHLALGRLEIGECEERVRAAVEARTWGELRALFADLPPRANPAMAARGGDPGYLPAGLRATLVTEGLLVIDEGVRGSITYRGYREPGGYSGWERSSMSGAVAVTGRRLLAWGGGAKRVDVPLGHPLRAAIMLSVDKPGRLCIAVDAGAFHPDRSGRIEYRFRTTRAEVVRGLLGST
ncbi:DUF1707 domain-containing protein [Amycolatopsis sp. GM8]|uniref:DUF1707 SHOCT-like domain-containing protein n=1 Tax=Amycolatopsis sp. GM8 TaxID=2896530 RepID=UPI001F4523AE|nr:DUF1707 domain-containing protein [Amycolatopsis sp. GM8]